MGSHKVIIHKIADGQEFEVPTNTTGWNGPSVAKMFNFNSINLPSDMQNWLGIATYNSENQIGYLNNTNEFQRIENYLQIPGKIEDFAVANTQGGLFIASAQYLKEDYSPNDSVQINFIDYTSKIDEDKNNQLISFYPNPAIDNVIIRLNPTLINSNVNWKICNLMGDKVMENKYDNCQDNEINVDIRNLSIGNYFIIITINNNRYINYFTIIR
jgi:hypothetical protein